MIAAPENFNEDPAHSHTLPGFYYYDPDVYAEEFERIFHRSWQYVGHVSVMPANGDYLVRDLGDQSVFVIRGEDGVLRAFHNVCQHRAHRPLEGGGNVKGSIVCPYHAWSYALDGRLLRARGAEGLPDFDKSRFGLKPVRMELLCGYAFVNLDADAASLAEVYPGLEAELRGFSPRPEELRCVYRKEYPLAANWKNSVENFSECYHCPGRHKSLSGQALDINSYRIHLRESYHSHRSRDRGERQGYAVDGGKAGRPNEFGGWLIWPNLSLEVFPGGNLNVFHHVPVAPERTVQVVEWYFPDDPPTAEQQAVIDFMSVVREEDLPICESVQKGLHSKGYTQGRFVVDDGSYMNEHAVHHFQAKVLACLGRARTAPSTA